MRDPVTKDLLRAELLEMRAEIRAELSELRTETHKGFVEVYRDLSALTRTLWITQLSAVALILVGVGLLLHFKL